MGTKRFDTTWDLVRHGANLQVSCACGHVAVIDRNQLDYMRQHRNWPRPLGYLRGNLTCAKRGQRPTSLSPTPKDPTVRIGLSLAEAIAARRRDETRRIGDKSLCIYYVRIGNYAGGKVSVTSSRKDQALAFISKYIVREGRSPAMGEIATALGVSDTRAKALVKKLAAEKMIERAPGSQRAITVPGLMDRHIQQRMRAMGGFVINSDFMCPLESLPLPQGHLPLVAIIDHIPATEGDFDGNSTE